MASKINPNWHGQDIWKEHLRRIPEIFLFLIKTEWEKSKMFKKRSEEILNLMIDSDQDI
jgi:hypothetical protein